MTRTSKWVLATTGVCCLLLFAAIVTGLYIFDKSNKYFDARLRITEQIEYEVPSGEGIIQTIRQLAKRKLIEEPPPGLLLQIMLYHQELQYGIKRGDYLLEPGIILRDALELFRSGKVEQKRWTLLEGVTLVDFIPLLLQHQGIDGDIPEVTKRSDYPKLARSLGLDKVNPEGIFLANTYFFERGTKASELLQRAYRELEQLQHTLEPECTQLKNTGLVALTPYQRTILASIIEKETGLASERPLISAVFHNRLKRGMYLQTDPTVIYGIGDAYAGNITKKHLRTPSAYNTYTFAGLPPTPISSFGEDSLRATCNPDKKFLQQGVLFFVGKGDGSHKFSITLREHNRAVRRYQLKPRKGNSLSQQKP